MAFKAPKITKTDIYQIINIKDFAKVDLSNKSKIMDAIGQKILDQIKSRTENGTSITINDSGNSRFGKLKAPYSKKYADSMEFKAFGKSKSKVNLKLTGDMLGLMDFTIDGNKIKIGWPDAEDQIPKAYNHQEGDTVPKRPFFGISKGEINTIVQEFKDLIDEVKKKNG